MSGPHAAYRIPNRPDGTLNPDGSPHHVLDHTPGRRRISNHRAGRMAPWNDHTRARVDRYVRRLVQSRKTETVNRNAGITYDEVARDDS